MIKSSLLAIGLNENESSDGLHEDNDIFMWRVDPTGQFWSLDAGAVGRAAIYIEAELLNKVRQWLNAGKQQTSEEEDTDLVVSNKDVKAFLSSLTVEDALTIANDCLVNGIKSSIKHDSNLHSNELLDNSLLYDKGLRKRLKSAIIRAAPFGITRASPSIELIRG